MSEDFIEGQRVVLKAHGIPVAWAKVVADDDGNLKVVWKEGEAIIPLPVFSYEVEKIED